MYRVITRTLTKLAGTAVPKNPKQWPAELLKALASQHEYIDTSQIDIKFDHHDADERFCRGRIVLGEVAVIPFSIRHNDTTKKMELDPLDIVYDGQAFRALTESALRQIMARQPSSRVEKRDDQVPTRNEYIGKLTGDITPLEWSYYPSSLGGPRTAGAGLLSYVVRNEDDIDRLYTIVQGYQGINAAAQAMGLGDSLENLRYGMVESPRAPRLTTIMRQGANFVVNFDDGQTNLVSPADLKAAMGAGYDAVRREVVQRGWCAIREFPTMKTVSNEGLELAPLPVRTSGFYVLTDAADGHREPCYVFSGLIDFDGQNIKDQKALRLSDRAYALGKAFNGRRLKMSRDIPTDPVEVGMTGFFVSEAFGRATATPNVTIEQIIELPENEPIMVARREITGERIGIVLMPIMIRPQEMTIDRRLSYDGLLPEHSYYLPGHMAFVAVGDKIEMINKGAQVMSRPEVTLQKSASMWHMFGQVEQGRIDWRDLNEGQVITKLARLGVPDDEIERALHMKTAEQRTLYGLSDALDRRSARIKMASLGLDYAELKMAAEQALQAVEQSEEALADPQIVDATLALQFVSDETLRDLLGSEELFQQCEDRLARMLLAARQGEKSIHEKGVQRALKGIGEARKSLKTLAIELDAKDG